MFDENFLKSLGEALARMEGDFKEIYLKSSKGLVITRDMDSESSKSIRDCGAGIRIRKGGSWRFSCVSTDDRDRILSFVERNAEGNGHDNHENEGDFFEEGALSGSVEDAKRSVERAAGLLKDENVSSFLTVLRASEEECSVVNSEGIIRSEKRNRTTFYAQAEIDSGGTRAKGADCAMEMKNLQECPLEELCAKVAGESLRLSKIRLDAKVVPDGEMPVVLESRAAGMFIHEAAGHILEADNHRIKGLGGLLGESVSRGCFSLFQKCPAGGLASFDDEGLVPSEKILIENGKIVSLLSDRRSAGALNVPMTGNARRENYNFEPLVRMWKIESPLGTESNEELISGVAFGILIKRLSDGVVNLREQRFVFPVAEGYLIRNGRISEAVSDVEIMGETLGFLKRIVGVGSEREENWGLCMKNNQTVWVGEEIPSLKIDGVGVKASSR